MMIVIMMMKSCLTNEACFHEALNVTAYADKVSVFLGYECVPWPELPSLVKDLQLASLSCGASRCQVRSIHDSHNFYILYFNFFKVLLQFPDDGNWTFWSDYFASLYESTSPIRQENRFVFRDCTVTANSV